MTEKVFFDHIRKTISGIEDVFTGKAHDDAEVSRAEAALGVPLPVNFKYYLKAWGRICLGSTEYYGLTQEVDFSEAGIPNFVWFTQRKRDQIALPTPLVVFQNTNDEVYYCLDTSKPLSSSECEVVVWDNLNRNISSRTGIGFLDFLIDDIEEYAEIF